MRKFLLALIILSPLYGEIVDKLAVAVGKQVITELQLDEELRVTALLNHQPVKRDTDARRSAADRLVEQLLIRHEMELSRYPLPSEQEVTQYLDRIRAETRPRFAELLTSYDLSEATVREHLTLQLMTLRFIEYRFRPDASVSDNEIESAYREEVAAWKANHTGNPPTLEASRDALRQKLLEEHTDSALTTWLAESRKQVNIVYVDKALQ